MGFCPKILVRGLGVRKFLLGIGVILRQKLKKGALFWGVFLGGPGGWGSFLGTTPIRGPPKVNREESGDRCPVSRFPNNLGGFWDKFPNRHRLVCRYEGK